MAASVQRLSHVLRTMAAVALMVVGSYAVAQQLREGHPQTYVVQRGDTLWDIAGRFLQRPWLWPEIWQANPQIRNPHLIYPGDVISLAYANRLGVQPGPRTGTPVPGVPLAQIEPFLRDLRVLDEIQSLPYVVAVENNQTMGVDGHVVYVRGLAGAAVGTRYAILRPVQTYTMGRRRAGSALVGRDDLDHAGRRAWTNYERLWTETMLVDANGIEPLGYELRKVNAGVLTRGEVPGIEVSTVLLDGHNVEVRPGDRLVPVEAIPYDPVFYPHAPRQQFPYGKAQVLSVAQQLTSGGTRDVVALSVGRRDGVDNGTVFSAWRVGSNVTDRVAQGTASSLTDERSVSWRHRDRVRLPDEFAGHIMIFRTFDRVSYGLVMDSIKPVRVGYELKHPDAPY